MSKYRMTTRVITSIIMSVSTMRFLLEILSVLKAIKFSSEGSYDKQNLTVMVISYEIYETSRLVSSLSYEMTTPSCKTILLNQSGRNCPETYCTRYTK